MGIIGIVLNLIKSHLTDRKQRIKWGKMPSDYSDMKYDVLQATVLVPTLLLICINNLLNICFETCYVDDTVVLHATNNIHSVPCIKYLVLFNILIIVNIFIEQMVLKI